MLVFRLELQKHSETMLFCMKYIAPVADKTFAGDVLGNEAQALKSTG